MTYLPLHVSGEVTVGYVLEMALVSVTMVHDVHITVLVHPQFTHDDVVHRGRHLAPRVVIPWT